MVFIMLGSVSLETVYKVFTSSPCCDVKTVVGSHSSSCSINLKPEVIFAMFECYKFLHEKLRMS